MSPSFPEKNRMKILTIPLKQKLILILLSTFTFNQAMAESKMEIKEKDQAKHQQHKIHSKQLSEGQKYHGVFYGLLPCKDCDGIKTTLSLKNRNNYLIVTQPAKVSAREYFEKGKYTWDDEAKTVTLTSRKDSTIRKYRIKDEKTLVQLSSRGLSMKTNQKNTSYLLRQKKMVEKSTSMHMH